MNLTTGKRRGDVIGTSAAPAERDLGGDIKSFGLIWGIPIAGLGLGGFFDVEAFVWPPALTLMGVGCLMNAFRCGRLHCFITGPFFLAAAVASILHGSGLVPFGAEGWKWLGFMVFVGGIVLTCAPEMIWRRYVRR